MTKDDWNKLTEAERTVWKNRVIERDIRTPWSRKRLARAMCGLKYEPPSRMELAITPLYLSAQDLRERIYQRSYSWFLRTFVGIDNRSYDDIHCKWK